MTDETTTAKTDGRTWYDAYIAAHPYLGGDDEYIPYDDLADEHSAAMEAGAQAVAAPLRARIGELEAERDYTRSEFQLLCADHDHLSAERNQLVARLATAVHGLRAITHGAPDAAEACEIAERAMADACAGLDT